MKKHQKHTALTRPEFGTFGRQEFAILGTNCGAIQKLSFQIIEALGTSCQLGYVDADHKSADEQVGADKVNALTSGAGFEYTDKIDFHRFDSKSNLNEFQYRSYFNGQDAVLINGNHFKGKQQIVCIDAKKKDSLFRKLDRLTDVQAFIFTEGETELYDFLKTHIKNWENLPIFNSADHAAIIAWMSEKLKKGIAPINGLVLAGGKSQRMGKDKTTLQYHGIPQVEFVTNLLKPLCQEVFISCREEQTDQFQNHSLVKDSFIGLGPFGAILSAFRKNPNTAWLVMAIDLPLVDERFLQELLNKRNPSKQATAFLNPATNFPDPLLTIWEPRSYATLLQFLAQGYSCPRKVLINSDIECIESAQAHKLKNVNSPEELEEVRAILQTSAKSKP